VLYYGACLVERGCSDVLPLIEDTLQRYSYSKAQAEAMTIAKYLLRGAGLPKAVESERIFIRMAQASIPAFWQSISALPCSSKGIILSDNFHMRNLTKAS